MTPKINWSPNKKDIRKFGHTILIGFGLIGGLVFFRGHAGVAKAMWAGSVIIWLLSMAAPVLAKPFYWLWMGIALVMGSIMSRVVMSIIFFFVVTPVALVFKLIGRDALVLKKKTDKSGSYWEEHPKIEDAKYYEHLF